MSDAPETQTEAQTEPQHAHEIPGLRAMAIVRWLLLALVAALAAGTWWTLVLHDQGEASGEARYYCPMHPQITSPTPGTCPICHMTLEPIPRGEPASAEDAMPEMESEADEGHDALVPVMLTLERRQRSGIATVAAHTESIAGSARVPAVIEASEAARAEVRVRAEGYLERVLVRASGVRVRAGQTLAWVYAPDILRAEEELLAAHRWSASGTDGATRVPEAEAAARQRLALLGVGEREIDEVLTSGHASRQIAIRAPVSGYVTALDAVPGGYATPATRLYEITSLAEVWVVATAYGPELEALRDTSTSTRFVPRGGGEPIALRLALVEPRVEGTSRASRVRFTARNAGVALLPGAIGEVELEGASREQLVVPRDAVIDTGLRRYVFVERAPGTFEPRDVTLGGLRGEDRIVTEGLTAGERVVARGAFVLDSESRLAAALAPAAGTPGASSPAGTPAPPAGHAHTHGAE